MKESPNIWNIEYIENQIKWIKNNDWDISSIQAINISNDYNWNISYNSETIITESLLEKYLQEETLHIWDNINDEIEQNIINALTANKKWENLQVYINELEKLWVQQEVLKRIEYIWLLGIYGEWQIDRTDEFISVLGITGIIKGWIKYLVQKWTGKIIFKLSHGQAIKEIRKISYSTKKLDLSKFPKISLEAIKHLNAELYSRIIKGNFAFKTANWVTFKFVKQDKFNVHIKGTPEYNKKIQEWTFKSYFDTKFSKEQIYDLHIEAMWKIGKEAFEALKNWKGEKYYIDLWRRIWVDVWKNKESFTTKIGISVNKDWIIHWFPVHQNTTLWFK